MLFVCQVVLRIRPFTDDELKAGPCESVMHVIENEDTISSENINPQYHDLVSSLVPHTVRILAPVAVKASRIHSQDTEYQFSHVFNGDNGMP